MWLGLGSLVILALLVIFVLPAVVTEYELPLERRVDSASTVLPATVPPAESGISPFEAAQQARQRQQAQEVLAELLDLQARLEVLAVNEWGRQAYAAALAEAAAGDEHYRQQDFLPAAESYTRGRDSLTALLNSTAEVLQRLLTDAEEALAAGDAGLAQQRFSLALVLDVANETAQTGLQRAQVRDQVADLLGQADERMAAGELETAKQLYRQVLTLDSLDETAAEKIAAVEQQLTENEFARIMSEGYALLQADAPEQAIAAFQRAAGLGINQAEARAAILQTETEVANAQINALREQIAAAEQAERWADAVAAYDAVLAIDPNLSFADTGRVHASQRANLDAFLEHAIQTPERLAEEQVFEQTRGYYLTARNLADPGPRLQTQLDQLEQLLLNSRNPLEIQLVSDNLTEVTVLRVASLGLFEQRTLSLIPGKYVAIGKRAGYRDVREEFTVGFGQTPAVVVVRCSERVVASSGR